MADFYAEVGSDVSFGDVFNAPLFHDVFLKADAVQMGTRDIHKSRGGGLQFAASFERNREFVLGRGAPCRGLLISDNCLVDRILSQGGIERRRQGRLLFAPIVELPPGTQLRDFGRFGLPAREGHWPDLVAELRRCFMVDAPDVHSHREDRIARLSPHATELLEVQWNAYAARRGPLANARNAEKVAELAGAAGEPDHDLGRLIAEAMAASWRVEGDALDAVSDVHAKQCDPDPELGSLEAALRELGEKSTLAANTLAARDSEGHA